MRVLLVIPTHNYKYAYPAFLSNTDFPVGFAYLAAALSSARHEVFGFNPNNITGYSSAKEMVADRLTRVLLDIQPEIIGTGGLCIDYKFLTDIIQIIRKLSPDVPIVCGGGIINNDAEFIFNQLQPDFCITGEGEEVLVDLVNEIANGGHHYEEIDNLGYWRDGVARFTRKNWLSGISRG